MSHQHILIVLSGPAGCGKSTLVQRVIDDHPQLTRAVTCTTRKPRAGENDGVDYHFQTREEFETAIANGEFVEHAEYNGNLYGLSKTELARCLNESTTIAILEVQGAEAIRKSGIPHASVFVLPPGAKELESRLTGRGTESRESLSNRLRIAQDEIKIADAYDHQIINEDLELAAMNLWLWIWSQMI